MNRSILAAERVCVIGKTVATGLLDQSHRSGKKLELKGIRLQLLACWKVKVTHS